MPRIRPVIPATADDRARRGRSFDRRQHDLLGRPPDVRLLALGTAGRPPAAWMPSRRADRVARLRGSHRRAGRCSRARLLMRVEHRRPHAPRRSRSDATNAAVARSEHRPEARRSRRALVFPAAAWHRHREQPALEHRRARVFAMTLRWSVRPPQVERLREIRLAERTGSRLRAAVLPRSWSCRPAGSSPMSRPESEIARFRSRARSRSASYASIVLGLGRVGLRFAARRPRATRRTGTGPRGPCPRRPRSRNPARVRCRCSCRSLITSPSGVEFSSRHSLRRAGASRGSIFGWAGWFESLATAHPQRSSPSRATPRSARG